MSDECAFRSDLPNKRRTRPRFGTSTNRILAGLPVFSRCDIRGTHIQDFLCYVSKTYCIDDRAVFIIQFRFAVERLGRCNFQDGPGTRSRSKYYNPGAEHQLKRSASSNPKHSISKASAFINADFVKPVAETMIALCRPVRSHLFRNASRSGTPTFLDRSRHSRAITKVWWLQRKRKYDVMFALSARVFVRYSLWQLNPHSWVVVGRLFQSSHETLKIFRRASWFKSQFSRSAIQGPSLVAPCHEVRRGYGAAHVVFRIADGGGANSRKRLLPLSPAAAPRTGIGRAGRAAA